MEDGVGFAQLDLDTERALPARCARELGVSTFGLNLIVLQPGQAGRIHRHERQEEVYLVLEGELSLLRRGRGARVLGRAALARVAPEVRRQLVNRRPRRLVLLALGGATDRTRAATASRSPPGTRPRAPAAGDPAAGRRAGRAPPERRRQVTHRHPVRPTLESCPRATRSCERRSASGRCWKAPCRTRSSRRRRATRATAGPSGCAAAR